MPEPCDGKDSIEQVISRALYIHQWTSDGGETDVPGDECDCCAQVVIHALRMAGYRIEPYDQEDADAGVFDA